MPLDVVVVVGGLRGVLWLLALANACFSILSMHFTSYRLTWHIHRENTAIHHTHAQTPAHIFMYEFLGMNGKQWQRDQWTLHISILPVHIAAFWWAHTHTHTMLSSYTAWVLSVCCCCCCCRYYYCVYVCLPALCRYVFLSTNGMVWCHQIKLLQWRFRFWLSQVRLFSLFRLYW